MKRSRLSKLRRRLLFALVALPAFALTLWIAIHRIPWLGPLLADSARAVVGPGPIATLEDYAYAAQDSWNRLVRGDERPKAYWQVPSTTTPPPASSFAPTASSSAVAAHPPVPPFSLPNVGPEHASWSAPGDGVWVPVVSPREPSSPTVMLKTLLHPDKKRSWAAVTVVALDMSRLSLHLVPGRFEPKSNTREGRHLTRSGLVPAKEHDRLVAAFNGGFKFEHGHYGMAANHVTIVRPRARVCTIVLQQDNLVRVGAWETFKKGADNAHWWRQTPFCLVQDGALHVGLRYNAENSYWGATVDGKTVIRRSAIGVDEASKVVYVGIGDSVTAGAMAEAMKHAGARNVAQLDVNWSFPKFVLFAFAEGGTDLVTVPIAKGFEVRDDEFIRHGYGRDFFYVTRR